MCPAFVCLDSEAFHLANWFAGALSPAESPQRRIVRRAREPRSRRRDFVVWRGTPLRGIVSERYDGHGGHHPF